MLAFIWHPFGANATIFCDMALGTCPWVPQGVILLVFWLDSCAILVTFGMVHCFLTFSQSSRMRLLDLPDFRCFFRGINTPAEYHHNVATREVAPRRYTTTITFNNLTGRPLAVGDRMEFEFSPFLVAPRVGRKNYYGTAMLYVVGRGIVPWHGVGERLQSEPLPESAWLGGRTNRGEQLAELVVTLAVENHGRAWLVEPYAGLLRAVRSGNVLLEAEAERAQRHD